MSMLTPALRERAFRLVDEWHQLKVAINLGHLQHERASADADVSLAASREACARALEEARAADYRREAAEERERELQVSNATLEWQVQARRAALGALVGGAPTNEMGLGAREDARALEALEHSLEHERLEVMERQVIVVEDALAAREVTVRGEADEMVAGVRKALADEYQ